MLLSHLHPRSKLRPVQSVSHEDFFLRNSQYFPNCVLREEKQVLSRGVLPLSHVSVVPRPKEHLILSLCLCDLPRTASVTSFLISVFASAPEVSVPIVTQEAAVSTVASLAIFWF